jgi:hypothetical protein
LKIKFYIFDVLVHDASRQPRASYKKFEILQFFCSSTLYMLGIPYPELSQPSVCAATMRPAINNGE